MLECDEQFEETCDNNYRDKISRRANGPKVIPFTSRLVPPGNYEESKRDENGRQLQREGRFECGAGRLAISGIVHVFFSLPKLLSFSLKGQSSRRPVTGPLHNVWGRGGSCCVGMRVSGMKFWSKDEIFVFG